MRSFFLNRTASGRVSGLVMVAVCAVISIGGSCTQPPPNGGGNDNDMANMNDNETPAPRCNPGTAGGTTTVSYNTDLIPMLANHDCLSSACHGGQFFSSNYDLRTYEGLFGPGEQAEQFGICNVVPGDAEASYLVEKLRGNPRSGLPMPQVGIPMTEEEIQMIVTWIEEGAQDN